MSYVADRNDIEEKWNEYNQASEKLSEVLEDAMNNSTFTRRQVRQCEYLYAQVKADRYKVWKEIIEVLKDEE